MTVVGLLLHARLPQLTLEGLLHVQGSVALHKQQKQEIEGDHDLQRCPLFLKPLLRSFQTRLRCRRRNSPDQYPKWISWTAQMVLVRPSDQHLLLRSSG